MAKKKNKGAVHNHQLAVEAAKEHFLSLCVMFENNGRMFKGLGKIAGHSAFAKTALPAGLARMLEQHQEIGEELKNLGAALDMCGGKPCMKKEDPKNKKEDDGTFVSNIAPKDESPGKDDDKKKKTDKDEDK